MMTSLDLRASVSEADQAFAQLIDRISDQLEQGHAVDQQALLDEYPEHEERLQKILPTLVAISSLGRKVTPAGLSGGPLASGVDVDAREPRFEDVSDYEILGEVGRGGMGVVYRARQHTLCRDVALKVLPWAALADRRQLARFENEARAAAALHHPHIVPVYSVGVERDIHYYAMQYIEGPTLAQVLEQLRCPAIALAMPGNDVDGLSESRAASDGDTVTGDAPDPIREISVSIAARRSISPSDYYDMAARWGMQAAEALAHAHEHGVVHRDIKPGNLLLEDQDHIWITDFGLARLDVGTTITGSGDLLGTLRYMSPEQVAGKGRLVDHRTDIYSLGVTLYEVLTLRPPFGEQSRGDLLRRIPNEEPLPPRCCQSSIPIDLETIVLKAMEKDPIDRYDTALELADDLQRFLQNHPIEARRPSLVHRLRKWAKRNVGLVLLGVLTLVLVSVTSSLAAALIWRANQNANAALTDRDAALDARDDALQRADKRATLARKAVDELYDGVATQWISGDRELTKVQRSFLDKAVEIYQQLGQPTASDPESRSEEARAWYRISRIRISMGQYSEAIDAAERAIPIYEKMLESEPDNVNHLSSLGMLYNNVANLLDSEEALVAYDKGSVIFERLIVLQPAELQHRLYLAALNANRSEELRILGRVEDAEQPARDAWEQTTRMVEETGNEDWEVCQIAFRAAGNFSLLLREANRYAEAEQVIRQAIASCEGWVLRRPDDPRMLHLLGRLRDSLGKTLMELERWEDAELTLRSGLAALEKSTPFGDSPAELFAASKRGEVSLDDYMERWTLHGHAECQRALAELLHKLGRDEEARLVLTECTHVLEQMTAYFPDVPVIMDSLADGHVELARLLQKRQPLRAEQRFQKACDLYRSLISLTPENTDYQMDLANVLSDLGNLMVIEGKHAQAHDLFESGIRHAKAALEMRPGTRRARDILDRLQGDLSQLTDKIQDVDA